MPSLPTLLFQARGAGLGLKPPPPGADLTQSRGPMIRYICGVLYGVASLVILARAYTRGRILKRYGADDYLIFVAWVLVGGTTASIFVQVRWGTGDHNYNLPVSYHEPSLKSTWAFLMLYAISAWVIKLSILALYLRIAFERGHRMGIWTVLVVVSLVTWVMFFLSLFQCYPVHLSWGPNFPDGCLNVNTMNYVTGIFNMISDVIVILLPIPVIFMLHLNLKKKIILCCIFFNGFLAVVASIARLVAINHWAHSSDIPWTWSLVPLLSAIELDLALITASLPSLKQLFEKIFGGGIFNSKNATLDNAYGMNQISAHSKGYDHTASVTCGADVPYKRGPNGGNESEENIITGPCESREDPGQVMKVTEFEVSYDNASTNSTH